MVSVNGNMVLPANGRQDPQKGYDNDNKKGKGSGHLEVTGKQDNGIMSECRDESASGSMDCTIDIKGGVTDGSAYIVSIARNRRAIGKSCKNRMCECREDNLVTFEYMDLGSKKVDLTDRLTAKVSGCGCYYATEIMMFLMSTTSPLLSDIKRKLNASKVTIPAGGGRNRIPPGALGTWGSIGTGGSDAAFLGKDATADMLTLLIDAAMDQVVYDCSISWDCCGKKRAIPDIPMSLVQTTSVGPF
jgi:hypothetical protein